MTTSIQAPRGAGTGDAGRKPARGAMQIPVKAVLPNPEQPRKTFDEAGLKSLAQSIKENDLIQPIVVERGTGGKYILVDGERRLRAVKILGWKQIDAVVRTASNHRGQERLTRALVANVQRSDLDVLEQALSYRQLLREVGSVKEVSRLTGVSTSIIDSRLSILILSEPVQKMYQAGLIPIDNNIIYRLKKLSHAEQEQIASIGVSRGGSTQTFQKLLTKAESGKPRTRKEFKRHVPETELAGPHFDALALVKGWRALPKEMVQVARQACQACELYPHAGTEICGRCALPDFLVRYRMM